MERHKQQTEADRKTGEADSCRVFCSEPIGQTPANQSPGDRADSKDHDRSGKFRFGKTKSDESGSKIRIYAIEAGTPYDHRHQTTRQRRYCERIELRDIRLCMA